MVDVEVQPDALRKSAEAARAAADEVRGLGLRAVNTLASAMPGTRAGERATALGTHWEQDTGTWAGKMAGYGDKLVTAASGYETNDQTVEQALRGR